MKSVTAVARPSLAFIKYWGKSPGGPANRPATPSLALTLEGITSTAEVCPSADGRDRVVLGGEEQPERRFAAFFDTLRAELKTDLRFAVTSANTFPTAAGLASSSSGFAALAAACATLARGQRPDDALLSRLARVGSGSACRAVYGGWTLWDAGAEAAQPLFEAGHWPELRVVLAAVHEGPKEHSSRDGMNSTAETSPFYPAWVADAPQLLNEARRALAARDLEAFGQAARKSYQRMFGTMLGADPPLIYWKPASLSLIRAAEDLRRQGLSVWETMDAGPQVKFLCTERDVPAVVEAIRQVLGPEGRWWVTQAGAGVEVRL